MQRYSRQKDISKMSVVINREKVNKNVGCLELNSNRYENIKESSKYDHNINNNVFKWTLYDTEKALNLNKRKRSWTFEKNCRKNQMG